MRIVAIGILLASSTAHAQTPADVLAKLRDYELRIVMEGIEHSAVESRSYEGFHNASLATGSIDPSNGLSTVEKAAAVIDTSVEGAAAGVVLAPFTLGGYAPLRGVTVSIGAFDDSSTRLGLGYLYEHRPEPLFTDLGLSCPPDVDDVNRRFDAITADFVEGCTVVARATPCTSRICTDAREACTGTNSAITTVTQAVTSVGLAVEGAAPYAAALAERLTGFSLPRPLECVTEDAIERAVTRWTWKQPHHKLSLSTNLDVFPMTWGFNPDGLEDFEAKGYGARLDYLFTKGGFELGFGAGYAKERSERGGDLAGQVQPSVRIATVVGALDDEPLEPKGRLRLEDDGSMPPHVVLGAYAEAEIATEDVENDSSKLRSLRVTIHIDFKYSDELAFRIGVPLQMQRLASMADPTDVGSQWTVPAFVATVLTLE